MSLPSIADVKDLKGKRVLLRLDLNVPIVGGEVRDGYRIERSQKTLQFLKAQGARTIIVSHTDSKETKSIKAVAEYLKKFIPLEFVPAISDLPGKVDILKDGDFLVLENLRQNDGEVANDSEFAKTLASVADIYVNEAFSASHRKHASIIGVPKLLPSCAGFLLIEEVENLSKAFNPPKPFVFVLAGDKFETKLPLVQKFLKLADSVFIGGALANDLLKVRGNEIGLSKHSEKDFGFEEIASNPKVILPVDVVVDNKGERGQKKLAEILPEDSIFDAGQETVSLLAQNLKEAKFVLWNGTLGVYEKGFKEGTESLAKALSEIKTESIVGGGDTVASISALGLIEKFSFVSTGGGAMLDFLANETLPGIEALGSKFDE